MKTNKVQFMTQAAMIAAIYVVLCVVFQPISYGPIQTRIAEALTVLPFLRRLRFPVSSWAVSSQMCWAAVLFWTLSPEAWRPLSPHLPLTPFGTRVSIWLLFRRWQPTRFIIPWVLKYGYGEPLPIPFMMGTVALGEILTATIIGTILLLVLDRYRSSIFKTAL